MPKMYVTPADVLAAQMLIELQLEDGEEPDPAVVAISKARNGVVIVPSSRTPTSDEARSTSAGR